VREDEEDHLATALPAGVRDAVLEDLRGDTDEEP
jgi:hypothetical protein